MTAIFGCERGRFREVIDTTLLVWFDPRSGFALLERLQTVSLLCESNPRIRLATWCGSSTELVGHAPCEIYRRCLRVILWLRLIIGALGSHGGGGCSGVGRQLAEFTSSF